MFYDSLEMLYILAHGGFFARALELDGGERYSLYQFIEGHCYEHLTLPARNFNAWLDTGALEYWRTVEDYEGRIADLFFLLGSSPLSK